MKEGEVTPAMRVATGWVFATVTGRQDAYVPKLDEVKTKVARRRDAGEGRRAGQAARRGDRHRPEGREGLRRRRQEGRPRSEDHRAHRPRRGDSRPRHQRSDRRRRRSRCRRAASATPSPRRPAPPSSASSKRSDVTDAEIEPGKDQLRDELVNQRRDKFFGAYMQKAKQGLKINIAPGHARARRRQSNGIRVRPHDAKSA